MLIAFFRSVLSLVLVCRLVCLFSKTSPMYNCLVECVFQMMLRLSVVCLAISVQKNTLVASPRSSYLEDVISLTK